MKIAWNCHRNPLDPEDPSAPGDPDCEDCTIVPVEQVSDLMITKTTTDRDAVYSEVGDQIEYTIVVVNTGNVSLYDVEVTDNNADSFEVGLVEEMASGEEVTFSATHTVTQDDINRLFVSNLAKAEGEDPNGELVSVLRLITIRCQMRL